MAKNLLILLFIVVGGILIYAYYSPNNPNQVAVESPLATSSDEMMDDDNEKAIMDKGVENNEGEAAEQKVGQKEVPKSQGWQDVQLSNINDGKSFKVSDYEGMHVVLESFAVWCPTCLKQQNEVKKARVTEVDQVVHIGLNTDPNEDAEKVKSYINEHGFDWFYAIAPKDMTQKLIDEFGFAVVNAPQAPMIHICPDGSAKLLKRGLKTAEELNEQIETGCEG